MSLSAIGRLSAFILVVISNLGCFVKAQPADDPVGDAYELAVRNSDVYERDEALEKFIATAARGPRRIAALHILIWDQMRIGESIASANYAAELIKDDPQNALALAALTNPAAQNVRARLFGSSVSLLSLARIGLRQADKLRRPHVMEEGDFIELSKAVRGGLSFTIGTQYLERKDHLTARKYLKQAVAMFPGNGQYAYQAALAFLGGKNPDLKTGYWLLARTVILTRGTEAGKRIAEFATEHYRSAGGTVENWRGFLAAAEVPAPPLSRVDSSTELAVSAPAAHQKPLEARPDRARETRDPATEVSSSKQQGSSNRREDAKASPATPENVARPQAQTAESEEPTLSLPGSLNDSLSKAGTTRRPQPDANERVVADASPAVVPPLPPPESEPEPLSNPLALVPETMPVSLGVLIETSLASRDNRAGIIYALSDILRRLRDEDEAFIVSVANEVTIEQDLTWNYELLEKAMERVEPRGAATLSDAIAFAAAHLKRIARNPNRALLVISDGTKEDAQISAANLASAVSSSGVRVHCVGIGVADGLERRRLEELSGRTGGKAMFIVSASEFRSAARHIAAGIGIQIPD